MVIKIKQLKKLGQHFLQEPSLAIKIVELLSQEKYDCILEIGPGSGVLTEQLLKLNIPLVAIEIDKRWAAFLQQKFSATNNFHLICDDILQVDWHSLGAKKNICLVGNLPYAISSPLFFKLLKNIELIDCAILMFQKEFGERLIGDKTISKKNYGALAVLRKLYFSLENSFVVPKICFSPAPKVDSIVLKMRNKNFMLPEQEQFCIFLRKIFQQPRQTILNNLKKNFISYYNSLSLPVKDNLAKLRPADLNELELLQLFKNNLNIK